MYAVIDDRSTQFTVRPGDVIECALHDGWEAGQSVTFDRVHLVGAEGQTRVGKPFVDGAVVTGEVLDTGRGPKVVGLRFRRRKNIRVRRGHRQGFVRVRITDVKG